jgi:hypothetical protein
MKRLSVLAVVALLTAGATSAGAQGVNLQFQDGKVRLNAQNATVRQILSEWSRSGRTTIVNGERVAGPPVSIELQDVSEQQALDIVLRGVSGYLVASRETAVDGASRFDRVYILPTSSRPTNAAVLPAPPQPVPVQDDLDDDFVPEGPRGANLPPGARMPRDVGPGIQLTPGSQPGPQPGRPPIPFEADDRDEPENRPAPAPNNPFGVAPGTSRPGVISPVPAPQPNRPNQ